jgi:hypothetical protein
MAGGKIQKTGGLLDQYNLLGAIIDAPWATRLDHKVARHVIDRYYPKHGNGRASLRYLERATGSSRSNITTSLRRLAYHGAIVMVRPGHGTRPSEFALNFDFTASVPVDVTSSGDFPSGTVEVTSSGHVDDTSSSASVPVDVTESYLPVPAYKAGVRIDRNDCGLATPGADGLAATSPATPQEERANSQAEDKPTFVALWRAYDYAKGKKEARAAWDALPADVDRAAVIAKAGEWRESWAAQGKPDAPRFTLARWLKDERYDEDAPKGFTKVERGKSATKAKPTAKHPKLGIGSNIKHFTITAYETEGSPFADWFEIFTFQAEDGHEFTQRLHVLKTGAEDAPDQSLRHELYCAAFGRGKPEGNYVGRVIGVTEEKGELVFWHCPDDNPDDAEYPDWASAEWREKNPADDASSPEPERSKRWLSAEIIDSDKVEETIVLWFRTARKTVIHEFLFDVDGERELARICKACGLKEIADTEELHGIPLKVELDGNDEIIDFGQANEWEVKRAKRLEREARVAEWDAEHPELFVDTPTDEAA